MIIKSENFLQTVKNRILEMQVPFSKLLEPAKVGVLKFGVAQIANTFQISDMSKNANIVQESRIEHPTPRLLSSNFAFFRALDVRKVYLVRLCDSLVKFHGT